MSNLDKLLYIDGLGEITQNLNIGGNINLTETLFTKKIGIGTSSIGIGTVLHITGDTTVQGHIIPSHDNTYTLGSTNRAFKDVYVGPGSLYVNGKKILGEHETDSNTINISTDTDEHIQINTNGTGLLKLQSENNDIQLIIKENKSGSIEIKKNTGGDGDISLTNSGNNGNISLINAADGNIVLQKSGLGDINITNSNTTSTSTIDITSNGGGINLSSSVTTISGELKVDTINEITTNAGVTIEGVLLKDNNLNVDTIREYTTNAGVTIHNPIIKGASNDENRIVIKDKNLSNNMYIQVPDITNDINLTLPNQTGTLALSSQIPTATAPIALNTINNNYYLDLYNENEITSVENAANILISTTRYNENIGRMTFANFQQSLINNGILSSVSGGGSSVWNTDGNKIYYSGGNVGIGVQDPRTNLDLAANYPNDHSVGSGQTSNIYLNTYNANSYYTSGIEWKPNFTHPALEGGGYSKISAFLRFVPTGDYFRGELHMGANYTENHSTNAPTVFKIKHYSVEINNASSGTLLKLNSAYGSWYIDAGGGNDLHFRVDSFTGAIRGYIEYTGHINQRMNFTGQHRCVPNNINYYNSVNDYIGLIVYATGDYKTYDSNNNILYSDNKAITINDSLPIIELTNTKKNKAVFGIISDKEEENRHYKAGAFCTPVSNQNDDKRLYINSIGEGAIWIVNTNGNLENGDYIQSSDVIGMGEKQDDDLLHNYTVAKITCNCDFDINSTKYNCVSFVDSTSGNTYLKAFVGCTYHCG